MCNIIHINHWVEFSCTTCMMPVAVNLSKAHVLLEESMERSHKRMPLYNFHERRTPEQKIKINRRMRNVTVLVILEQPY